MNKLGEGKEPIKKLEEEKSGKPDETGHFLKPWSRQGLARKNCFRFSDITERSNKIKMDCVH